MNKRILEPSEATSGLAVQATEGDWAHSTDGMVEWGVEVDSRDHGWIQELISGARTESTDICIGIGIGRMMPGDHIQHHRPHGSEFYYVLTGECITQVDGEDIRCRPERPSTSLPAACIRS